MRKISAKFGFFFFGACISISLPEAFADQTIECHYENSDDTAKISVGIGNNDDYAVTCNWSCIYDLENSNFTKHTVSGEADVDRMSSENVHSDNTSARVSGGSHSLQCARK